MTDVLTFFVPTATLEIQEFEYTKFAKLCKVAVPSASMRVYSIVFTHNGEVWHDTRRDNTWHQVLYTQVKGKEFQRSPSLERSSACYDDISWFYLPCGYQLSNP
jgi:hypothetical protein